MLIKISIQLMFLRAQIYKTFICQKLSLYVVTCKYVTFICFHYVIFKENSLKLYKRKFEIVLSLLYSIKTIFLFTLKPVCLLHNCYHTSVEKILGHEGFGLGLLKVHCVVVEVPVLNDLVVNVPRKVVELHADIELILTESGRR